MEKVGTISSHDRQQPKGLTHTQRQHFRRRTTVRRPAKTPVSTCIRFRSAHSSLPVPFRYSLLMGGTMTFLKSGYKSCCCKAITSLLLQSGSVIIMRCSRRAVRNVGIDVVCRFPRTVGSVEQFHRSTLPIRPSFPPRALPQVSLCNSPHKVDEGSSCSRFSRYWF